MDGRCHDGSEACRAFIPEYAWRGSRAAEPETIFASAMNRMLLRQTERSGRLTEFECLPVEWPFKHMPSQRWLHIIPVCFIMYTIAYIDRTNVSMAIPAMSRALHMNTSQAGGAAGVFFWGYVALQIPAGYLAQRWSPKRLVAISLMAWGLCSVGCGLVQTSREFWVMRLLLGVAEGGVYPAVLVLLSHWFPRGERARANAYWMLCMPVAVIVSAPLSGWILSHWNWRALLIAEGALPFVWLVFWWAFIEDYPHQARWISIDESDYLETTLREESRELDSVKARSLVQSLFSPVVLVMGAVYLLENIGNYGYLFWLPSALQSVMKMDNLLTGLLFAIPFVMVAIGMVVVSRDSDRRLERRLHVVLGLAWGGAFTLASIVLTGTAPVWAYAAISLVGAGSYAMLGPFWAIPSENLPRSVSGPAMGLVNALGNLGGYFGPLTLGIVYNRTHDFRYSFALVSAALFAAALSSLLLPSGALLPATSQDQESAQSEAHPISPVGLPKQ